MSILCCFCGAWIRKEQPIGAISHGCCRKCGDRILKQLEADEDGRPERPCPTH